MSMTITAKQSKRRLVWRSWKGVVVLVKEGPLLPVSANSFCESPKGHMAVTEFLAHAGCQAWGWVP